MIATLLALTFANEAWVPDHPIMRSEAWTVEDCDPTFQFRARDGRMLVKIKNGLPAASWDNPPMTAIRTHWSPGSPLPIQLGERIQHRTTSSSILMMVDCEGRFLQIDVTHVMRYQNGTVKSRPVGEALAIAEGLIRAFVARQVALRPRTAATLSCGGSAVSAQRITHLGRTLGRSTELADRLGFKHFFDSEECVVAFVKGPHTVRVFLGSRKVQVDGQMRDLGCSTMEDGGRIYVDQAIVPILSGID